MIPTNVIRFQASFHSKKKKEKIALTHFLKTWFCFPCYLDLKIFKSCKFSLQRLTFTCFLFLSLVLAIYIFFGVLSLFVLMLLQSPVANTHTLLSDPSSLPYLFNPYPPKASAYSSASPLKCTQDLSWIVVAPSCSLSMLCLTQTFPDVSGRP